MRSSVENAANAAYSLIMAAEEAGAGRIGDRLAVIVREAIDRVAAGDARDAIIRDALMLARLQELPADPAQLAGFITGPLYESVESRIGVDAAEGVLLDLAPLVERASSQLTTGVRAVSTPKPSAPPMILVATSNVDRGKRIASAATGCEVRVVSDLFALLSSVEACQAPSLSVVIDGKLPSFSAGTLVALRRVMPERAQVVLWGGDSRAASRMPGWKVMPDEADEQHLLAVLQRGAHEVETLPPPPLEDSSEIDVVVADHDATRRTALADVLRLRGFAVRTAADGYSALNLCIHSRPDLVIAAQEMPVVGGGELARLIREMLDDDAPPIVVVTDGPRRDVPGATRVIERPDSAVALLADLDELLG